MIKDIKQNIIEEFISGISKLFEDIEKYEFELEGIHKDILSKSEKFISIGKEEKSLSNKLVDIKGKINKELSSLELKKTSLIELKNKTDTNIQNASKKLEQIEESRKRKEIDLKSLNEEIKSIEPLKYIKESISLDIENMTKETKEIRNDLEVMKKEYLSNEVDFNKLIKQKEIELDTLNKEIETNKKQILPTIDELNKREEKVKTKEADLRIVEQRYKKLYSDKGMGFRT